MGSGQSHAAAAHPRLTRRRSQVHPLPIATEEHIPRRQLSVTPIPNDEEEDNRTSPSKQPLQRRLFDASPLEGDTESVFEPIDPVTPTKELYIGDKAHPPTADEASYAATARFQPARTTGLALLPGIVLTSMAAPGLSSKLEDMFVNSVSTSRDEKDDLKGKLTVTRLRAAVKAREVLIRDIQRESHDLRSRLATQTRAASDNSREATHLREEVMDVQERLEKITNEFETFRKAVDIKVQEETLDLEEPSQHNLLPVPQSKDDVEISLDLLSAITPSKASMSLLAATNTKCRCRNYISIALIR